MGQQCLQGGQFSGWFPAFPNCPVPERGKATERDKQRCAQMLLARAGFKAIPTGREGGEGQKKCKVLSMAKRASAVACMGRTGHFHSAVFLAAEEDKTPELRLQGKQAVVSNHSGSVLFCKDAVGGEHCPPCVSW